MKTRKKVLLTGASGTIGLQVLKQLYVLKNTCDITVFDVKSTQSVKKIKPFKKGIKVVYGSITNDQDLNKICYDQDVVIHLAAIIPPLADEKPELSFQVNAVGTESLIRLLELHSPNAFFLYSSSISVYGDRLNTPMISVNDAIKASEGDEYGKSKIVAEKTIQNCKLDWSIFRLTAIMGGHKVSGLMFHQPLKTSMEIATPEDTARAFVNAIEKQKQLSKKIFNLSGGENCRIIYDEFLTRSFKIFGLGPVDFPPKTFAEKNFHCGYYKDGDALNDILDFRKDTLESYFEKEKEKVTVFKKVAASILKKPIKNYLQRQSEPYAAYMNNDTKMMCHYFNQD